MTRKSIQIAAAADDPVELAVPETGGSFERQLDGSLKRLNDAVEQAPEPSTDPASDAPGTEQQEG